MTIFDPNMKKKKKTRKPFDMSLLEGNEESADRKDDTKEDQMEGESATDLSDFTGLKKKKKNKKTYNFEEMENSLPVDKENLSENGKTLSPTDADVEADNADEDDLDFDFTRKKKKKKKVNFSTDGAANEGAEETDVVGGPDGADDADGQAISASSVSGSVSTNKWLESDRDYTYDELLEIVFNIIKEKNPEIDAGVKKKFVMRPPQVLRVGTKKSSFANFLEICRSLHRQPKHMQAFLLTELGTSGSVDAANQLIIKGRFQQKQIESVLRRYIKEYVACQTCRSPDTILQKETRLFFLQCETCGSRRSVTN
ncbi:unnamed protein product, partial [Medioppia subpectinata]